MSDHGRVRSQRTSTPRILTGGLNTSGYPQVCVQTSTGQRTVAVHKLVAGAFLGSRPAPPPGVARIEVCHRNGDRLNNHAANLKYGTPKQNSADSIEHGTHTSLAGKAKTHCPRGHEYTPANTYYGTSAKGILTRTCRACRAERAREKRREDAA